MTIRDILERLTSGGPDFVPFLDLTSEKSIETRLADWGLSLDTPIRAECHNKDCTSIVPPGLCGICVGKLVTDACADRRTPLEKAAPDLLAALAPLANLWDDTLGRRRPMPNDATPVYGLNNNVITIGDIRKAQVALAELDKVLNEETPK